MIDEGHADDKLAVEEMLDTCLRIAVKTGTLKKNGKNLTPSLAGVITTALRAALTMDANTNEALRVIERVKGRLWAVKNLSLSLKNSACAKLST